MPRRALLLSFTLAFAVPAAHAEIFKCVGKSALPTYQNFPCQFDSAGSTTVAAAANVSPRAEAGARAIAATASTGTTPRVGMTTKEVKAIWGDPIDTSKEEYAKGNVETWTYANSRSIRFDLKGRVSEIEW
jgi:hypothetical protein